MPENQSVIESIQKLLDVIRRLRDPHGGCPWDLEQDFGSIAPHTIEEAYEVADAIERGAMAELRDELGDLLFQVVFHARIAEERQLFDFADVAAAITDKLIRRHPHVFGDARIASAAAQTVAWEEQKARERAEGGAAPGALDGIPVGLPGLARALKLGRRAARVGFDWPELGGVRQKVHEELDELEGELDGAAREACLAHELGDLLFSITNLARHLGIDPERALRASNARFERRFRHIERALAARGRSPSEASLDEMERLWQEAKADVEATGRP